MEQIINKYYADNARELQEVQIWKSSIFWAWRTTTTMFYSAWFWCLVWFRLAGVFVVLFLE